MAAVLAPQPRQGILLNRSPSVSPYRHTASLPPLVPSNASLSSTSSASNPNTSDSDYASSSTPASSNRGSRPLRPQKHLYQQKPRAGSTPTSRRIRFAPLPDPRREEYFTDGEHPLPSVFLEDTDSLKSDQNHNASSTGQGGCLKDQEVKASSASLLFGGNPHLRAQASESTPTLASTSTITANPNPTAQAGSACSASAPSTLEGGDWNVLSPRPSSVNLPEDPPSRSNSVRKSKWSRKLLGPLLAPLAKPNRSTDDLRTPGSTTSLNSTLTLPHSPGVEGCSIGLHSGAKAGDKEKPKKPKKKREDPEWVREFGMPLYRWSSEGDPLIPLNSKGQPMTIPELRDAGPDVWRKAEIARARKRSGSGTRMLNGRVYGAKRMHNQNAFANIRSEEPEFVEWGFGGMGSVQKGGVGAGIWAKVQSTGGVSVGAHDSTSHHRPAKTESGGRLGGDDDDGDGSGMGWVKRRREQREKEKREREAREREQASKQEEVQAVEAKERASDVAESFPGDRDPHASIFDPEPPQKDAEGHATPLVLTSSPATTTSALPGASTPSTEEKHVLTAVSLPPAHTHHHHHHTHSHSRSTLERAPSMVASVKGEPERRDSADTARGVPVATDHVHVHQPSIVDDAGVVGEVRRADSVRSEASHTSSSSTSEDADEGDNEEEDLESPKDEEEDDDDDDELEEESRLTALGAGVEKISRHRASTPVQDAETS